ncbi:hypothetical protein LTR28_010702, partial [Elasticomyces elasticus]
MSSDKAKTHKLALRVSQDDGVKAYIKKIMSQLDRWMKHSKISKLVIVISSKETGEPVERWQFDTNNKQVQIFGKGASGKTSKKAADKENTEPT